MCITFECITFEYLRQNYGVEIIYFGSWIPRVRFTALSFFGSGPTVKQKGMGDGMGIPLMSETEGREERN